MPDRLCGRELADFPVVVRESLRCIAVAEDLAEDLLVPGAGGRVPAPQQVKMISVPVHPVADEGSPGVLYGSTGRDYDLYADKTRSPVVGVHYRRIHLHLVSFIVREPGMMRILCIGPGLVHHEPGIRRHAGLDIPEKSGQEFLVRIEPAGQGARLLEAHIVPLFVGQDFRQPGIPGLGLAAFGRYFPVGIRRGVGAGIVQMAFKGTSSDICIADNDGDSVRPGKFMKVLFHGILGKTVADGKYPDRVFRGSGLYRHTG